MVSLWQFLRLSRARAHAHSHICSGRKSSFDLSSSAEEEIMTKVQEEQIASLKGEINALKLEQRHVKALIQGEVRRRHDHLETLPLAVREKAMIAWDQLILLFEEGLNQVEQDLRRKSMSLILLNENIRRESGHGHK
jgi:hypothetical protein